LYIFMGIVDEIWFAINPRIYDAGIIGAISVCRP
jgi:hypothetical protein